MQDAAGPAEMSPRGELGALTGGFDGEMETGMDSAVMLCCQVEIVEWGHEDSCLRWAEEGASFEREVDIEVR